MNVDTSKNKKNLSGRRKNTNYLLYLFLFTIVFSTFPFLASAESVKITDKHDFSSEGWIEEVLELSANEKIELGNYTVSYDQLFSSSMSTNFFETLSISEKRIDKNGFEKSYQIKSVTGTQELRELKNKSIILDRDTTAINVCSYEPNKLQLRIWSKKDIFSKINVSTTVPKFVLLYQDETVGIPLKINNSGLIDEIVSLEATESEFYTHKFKDGNFRVNKFKLDSGETKDIDLELKVDKDCTPGEYIFTVNASGRSSCTLNIPFTVEENTNKSEKSLAIQLSKIYVSGKAGSEVTIPVRVINSGDTNLKDIKLDIRSPAENWDVDVSKKKIDFLKSKEYESVELTVRIPASTEAGDYFVDIKGVADGVKTEETKLRINVKPQSNSAWIGIAIIVSIISILFVVYRKYGRR